MNLAGRGPAWKGNGSESGLWACENQRSKQEGKRGPVIQDAGGGIDRVRL